MKAVCINNAHFYRFRITVGKIYEVHDNNDVGILEGFPSGCALACVALALYAVLAECGWFVREPVLFY